MSAPSYPVNAITDAEFFAMLPEMRDRVKLAQERISGASQKYISGIECGDALFHHFRIRGVNGYTTPDGLLIPLVSTTNVHGDRFRVRVEKREPGRKR